MTQTAVDGKLALDVAIASSDAEINLTGDVVVDTLGALDDAAVVDPDSGSATIPALLRGILTQDVAILAKIIAAPATAANQATLIAAIGAAEDAANDPTVIGLLKQIIVKLGDVETAIGA